MVENQASNEERRLMAVSFVDDPKWIWKCWISSLTMASVNFSFPSTISAAPAENKSVCNVVREYTNIYLVASYSHIHNVIYIVVPTPCT